jgi:chondroitin 4-sulfotransferase 11
MISHEHKFIFIPVQRAAGVSINKALEKFSDGLMFSYGVMTDGFYEDIIKYRDYFIFSVIRNPWDKIVSAYFCSFMGSKFLGKRCSFIKFLENLPTKESNFKWWFHTARTLSDMLIDRDGNLIADFLIRFENIGSDFQYVCDKIGLDAKLPHLNATHREHYSAYYNDKTRGMVAAMFKRDIENFGYEYNVMERGVKFREMENAKYIRTF